MTQRNLEDYFKNKEIAQESIHIYKPFQNPKTLKRFFYCN